MIKNHPLKGPIIKIVRLLIQTAALSPTIKPYDPGTVIPTLLPKHFRLSISNANLEAHFYVGPFLLSKNRVMNNTKLTSSSTDLDFMFQLSTHLRPLLDALDPIWKIVWWSSYNLTLLHSRLQRATNKTSLFCTNRNRISRLNSPRPKKIALFSSHTKLPWPTKTKKVDTNCWHSGIEALINYIRYIQTLLALLRSRGHTPSNILGLPQSADALEHS